MKLGCFQSNRGLRSMAYADFVAGASALGYTAFDVPALDADALAVCRGQGVTIHATSAVNPGNLSTDAAALEEIVSTMKAAIDTVSAAGIATMTTLVGRDASVDGDANIALFKEAYTPIAAHGEAKGVRLAFENWPRDNTMIATTPEMWDAMFSAVPSPALGLCYDPSHLYWQGIDYIQPIWDFSDRIYHAHAKDTDIVAAGQDQFGIYGRQLSSTEPERWWRYRLPGYGDIDWFHYLDALYQVGYDDVLSVEHEDNAWAATPELALRGLQLAKQFLDPFMV